MNIDGLLKGLVFVVLAGDSRCWERKSIENRKFSYAENIIDCIQHDVDDAKIVLVAKSRDFDYNSANISVTTFTNAGEDLLGSLMNGIDAARDLGATSVVVIGADLPHVMYGDIEQYLRLAAEQYGSDVYIGTATIASTYALDGKTGTGLFFEGEQHKVASCHMLAPNFFESERNYILLDYILKNRKNKVLVAKKVIGAQMGIRYLWCRLRRCTLPTEDIVNIIYSRHRLRVGYITVNPRLAADDDKLTS